MTPYYITEEMVKDTPEVCMDCYLMINREFLHNCHVHKACMERWLYDNFVAGVNHAATLPDVEGGSAKPARTSTQSDLPEDKGQISL